MKSTQTPNAARREPEMDHGDKVDVEALMNRIREEVRSSVTEDASRRFPQPPGARVQFNDGKLGRILHCDELNFLHAHWNNWLEKPEFTSHRPLFGKVVVKFKSYLERFVMEVLFKGYFKRLYDFNWNLVQYLTRSANYIDARDSQNFWELIRKLDNDIAAINDKCDRLHDQVFAMLSSFEKESAPGHEKALEKVKDR